ncbi:MAG: YHS domain-containing protein [Planctomycetota bacterium]
MRYTVLAVGISSITLMLFLSACGANPTAPVSAAPTAHAAAVATVVPQAANTVCPVMDGESISRDHFADYKGKRIYFCCPDCIPVFKADPEKYTGNLR